MGDAAYLQGFFIGHFEEIADFPETLDPLAPLSLRPLMLIRLFQVTTIFTIGHGLRESNRHNI